MEQSNEYLYITENKKDQAQGNNQCNFLLHIMSYINHHIHVLQINISHTQSHVAYTICEIIITLIDKYS